MSTFDVAHFQEQGQQIIVVFVNNQIGHQPSIDQNKMLKLLQRCASTAGLAGTAVAVWDAGGGRMGFLAPPSWHPFFNSISLQDLALNINKKLTCGD